MAPEVMRGTGRDGIDSVLATSSVADSSGSAGFQSKTALGLLPVSYSANSQNTSLISAAAGVTLSTPGVAIPPSSAFEAIPGEPRAEPARRAHRGSPPHREAFAVAFKLQTPRQIRSGMSGVCAKQ